MPQFNIRIINTIIKTTSKIIAIIGLTALLLKKINGFGVIVSKFDWIVRYIKISNMLMMCYLVTYVTTLNIQLVLLNFGGVHEKRRDT